MASKKENKPGAGLYLKCILCFAALISVGKQPWAQTNVDDNAVSAEITQIRAPVAPTMRNDSLIYNFDIMFKNFKGKYWSYPDNANRSVMIELYGIELASAPAQFTCSSPVRNMSIKNQSTKMSLSGKLSIMEFAIDKGWGFDVVQPDSAILRVSLSKKMEIKEIKEGHAVKKSTPIGSYLGAVFGAAVALSVAVVAIINK